MVMVAVRVVAVMVVEYLWVKKLVDSDISGSGSGSSIVVFEVVVV